MRGGEKGIWFMIRRNGGAFSRWARTNKSMMGGWRQKNAFRNEWHLHKDRLFPESDFGSVFILRCGFLIERQELLDLLRQRFKLIPQMVGHDIGEFVRRMSSRQFLGAIENGAGVDCGEFHELHVVCPSILCPCQKWIFRQVERFQCHVSDPLDGCSHS